MILHVEPELLVQHGLAASALVAHGLDNSRIPPELVAYRQRAGQRLAGFWKNRSVSSHPVLAGYHRLHEQFGATEEVPAPEKLLTYVRRHRDFTSSSALVDCYNIVSARTLLSIGAHDRARLALPVTLRRCGPDDVFVPLGGGEEQRCPGEYGYVDARGRIICRLDVLQCEPTRTDRASRDVVFFLQGNGLLSAGELLRGTWLLAEMIETFCGGRTELAAFFDAAREPAGSEPDAGGRAADGPVGPFQPAGALPEVGLAEFRGLTLCKGTLLQAEPLPGLPDLAVATVRGAGEVRALLPASALAGLSSSPDDRAAVVVAGPLRPLALAGTAVDHLLVTTGMGAVSRLVRLEAGIPDGKRLC